MTYRTVLFDLFDTLVYTRETSNRQKAIQLAQDAGLTADDWLRGWRGTSHAYMQGKITTMYKRIQKALMIAGMETHDEALVEILSQLLLKRIEAFLFEDTINTLSLLREQGRKIALVSNITPEEKELFEGLNFTDCFDALALSCEVGFTKPDKKIYLDATEKLGVAPAECIFVGDGMSEELTGAKALGMTTVRIDRPGPDMHDSKDEVFDYHITCLAQLSDILEPGS